MAETSFGKDENLIQKLFGLTNTEKQKILRLASKQNRFYSVTYDRDQFNQFHIYPDERGTDIGKEIGAGKTFLLFPKTENINDIKPDILQWFELYTFFNLLSTLDLSLSQPFINITWHDYTYEDEATIIEDKVSLGVIKDAQISGFINEINDINTAPYFMPQVHYGKSINKFRPFLGIKAFDVEITSPIGLIATKYATLRLVLFDITRLAEARKFLLPGPRGPAIRIEYGWTHPYGDKTFESRFINSLRDINYWRVANYSVTIQQNNTAEITLELASMAAYKLARAKLIPPTPDTYQNFTSTNEKLEQKIEKNKNELNIKRKSLEEARRNNNKKEKIKPIINSITKLEKDISKLDLETGGDSLVKSVKKSLTDSLQKDFFEKIFTTIKKEKRIDNGLVSEFEKFLNSVLGSRFNNKWFEQNEITYLGVLAFYLFGQSVAFANNEIEDVETQIIFFDFNKDALDMGNKNISSFAIKKTGGTRSINFLDRIKKYILKTKIINPVVMDVINIINEEYLRNPINNNYGIGNEQLEEIRDKTGKTVVEYKLNDKTQRFIRDIKFIIPSVKFYITESDAQNVKNKALSKVRRIFVYDEASISDTTELEKLREKIRQQQVKENSFEAGYSIVRSQIPFVQIGTERTVVKNLSMQTMDHPLLHSIFARKLEKAESSEISKEIQGFPAQFFPMQVTLDILGFPNIQFGSKLFIDARTGTTVDNIYRITGVKHSFEPGKLSTQLDLVPDDAWLKVELQKTEE